MAEGFDTNRFQSTIDTSFTCPICFGVLKDPMQCENNEHYFCSGCIKKHLEKTSHSCPVCREKLTAETLRKAPRLIADVISRLKISCDHAARGCDAVLELEALQAHVQDCDFMPVTCSNDGCDEVVNKRD
ncbi:E3 ubiquitin- ligase NRDP1, partial [Paramuricea clavata]